VDDPPQEAHAPARERLAVRGGRAAVGAGVGAAGHRARVLAVLRLLAVGLPRLPGVGAGLAVTLLPVARLAVALLAVALLAVALLAVALRAVALLAVARRAVVPALLAGLGVPAGLGPLLAVATLAPVPLPRLVQTGLLLGAGVAGPLHAVPVAQCVGVL